MINLEDYREQTQTLARRLASELDGHENIVALFALLALVASAAEQQGNENMTLEARAQIYNIAIGFLEDRKAKFLKEAEHDGVDLH